MNLARIVLTSLVAVPLLAGCVNSPRVGLEARLQSLVGGGEQDLVRRMGAAPTRVSEQGGLRYLSWMHYWPDGAPGAMGGAPAAPVGDLATAERSSRFCETTFALDQGRVAGYSLRGESCGWGGFPRVAPT